MDPPVVANAFPDDSSWTVVMLGPDVVTAGSRGLQSPSTLVRTNADATGLPPGCTSTIRMRRSSNSVP